MDPQFAEDNNIMLSHDSVVSKIAGEVDGGGGGRGGHSRNSFLMASCTSLYSLSIGKSSNQEMCECHPFVNLLRGRGPSLTVCKLLKSFVFCSNFSFCFCVNISF